MRIYSIVLIAQLKSAIKESDPYDRIKNDNPSDVVKKNSLSNKLDVYKIEALINKRINN